MESNFLQKPDLEALDKELDGFVPSATLSERTSDELLFHLYLLADVGEKTKTIQRLDWSALDFATTWILTHSKPANHRKLKLTFDEEVWKIAIKVYGQARNYRRVSDVMRLLFKNKMHGRRTNNHIDTELNAAYDIGMAATESYLFSANDPTASLPADRSSIENYLSRCKPQLQPNQKLKTTIPKDLLQALVKLLSQAKELSWQLDPEIDFGGYKLSQFRLISEWLCAYAMIQHSCNSDVPLQSVALKHIRVNSQLKVLSRERWIKLLSNLTGLDVEKTELILTDLTMSKSLKLSDYKIQAASLPFVEISDGILLLSNRIAMEGNSERNHWQLLSCLRKGIFNVVSTRKEEKQIKELCSLFSGSAKGKDYLFVPTIPVGKETNIDLLVLDRISKFGLVMQLKWPFGPSYLREMQTVWEELQKGQKKLEVSLDWARSLPSQFTGRIEIPASELKEFQFEGIVVSRNSIGFGWSEYRQDIPICSERLLEWALQHKGLSLKQLWLFAGSYSYKLIQNTHFEQTDRTFKFGNITVTEHISFKVLKDFDPLTDIPWSSWQDL